MKPKQKGNSITKNTINKSLYNWIINHPQVVKSIISNDCLEVNIGGHTRPHIVTKLLPKVSIRELHISLFSDPEDGGPK